MAAGVTLLLTMALLTRIAGAAVCQPPHGWAVRAGGWLLIGVSAWLVSAAAGAWTPLWMATLGVPLGMWLGSRLRRLGAMPWADALLIGVLGLASTPMPGVGLWVLLTVAYVVMGAMADSLAWRLPVRVRQVGFGMLAALGLMAMAAVAYRVNTLPPPGPWYRVSAMPYVSIAGPRPAERRELPRGAVAWFNPAADGGVEEIAVVFHGAHADGSRQPATRALARALQAAGYATLRVDHPGTGQSQPPPPEPQDRFDAWDPIHVGLEALAHVQEHHPGTPIIVVGHSMGAVKAIRVLERMHDQIDAVVLFGASLPDGPERDAYWNARFLSGHGLPADALPSDKVRRLRLAFYDPSPSVRRLAELENLPPIVFARFGMEHANLLKGREALYEMLPEVRQAWELPDSDHYFNTLQRSNLLVGDVRVTQQLIEGVRDIAEENEGDRLFSGKACDG